MNTGTLDELLSEIELLMQYAVPPGHLEEATELVRRHEDDRMALTLFHAFYSHLPDAVDDAVKAIRLVAHNQGTFLLAAQTLNSRYLYLANNEEVHFLGTPAEGVWDAEVLDFFGFADRKALLEKIRNLDELPEYKPLPLDMDRCPVCATGNGEYHTLGCPVEVCPWCGGQLAACNCRFTQLGEELLDDESQLELLLEKINEAGRIPFDAERHRPGYPASSAGLDTD